MESIYSDGTYLDANPGWHAEDSPHKARWIAAMLNTLPEHPQTVAEIGCGAGEILLELQKSFPSTEFSGFEISPQAYSICSTKSEKGVNFHFEDLTKSEAIFDVLMAIDVFEHVPDYIGFIKSLNARAKYKIFHVPLDLSVQGLLRGKGIMHARKHLGHLHYFEKETALATLRDCGLEIVDWRYTLGAEELPRKALRTRILNLPRKILRHVDEDFAVRLLGGASLLVLTR